VADKHDRLVELCRLGGGFDEPGWVAGRCGRDKIGHDGFVSSIF